MKCTYCDNDVMVILFVLPVAMRHGIFHGDIFMTVDGLFAAGPDHDRLGFARKQFVLVLAMHRCRRLRTIGFDAHQFNSAQRVGRRPASFIPTTSNMLMNSQNLINFD